jgi:hypothetical protein
LLAFLALLTLFSPARSRSISLRFRSAKRHQPSTVDKTSYRHRARRGV